MFRKGWVLFFKTVFELKTTTYINVIPKETSIPSHIQKRFRLVNIFKTAYRSQGYVKKCAL